MYLTDVMCVLFLNGDLLTKERERDENRKRPRMKIERGRGCPVWMTVARSPAAGSVAGGMVTRRSVCCMWVNEYVMLLEISIVSLIVSMIACSLLPCVRRGWARGQN